MREVSRRRRRGTEGGSNPAGEALKGMKEEGLLRIRSFPPLLLSPPSKKVFALE